MESFCQKAAGVETSPHWFAKGDTETIYPALDVKVF